MHGPPVRSRPWSPMGRCLGEPIGSAPELRPSSWRRSCPRLSRIHFAVPHIAIKELDAAVALAGDRPNHERDRHLCHDQRIAA